MRCAPSATHAEEGVLVKGWHWAERNPLGLGLVLCSLFSNSRTPGCHWQSLRWSEITTPTISVQIRLNLTKLHPRQNCTTPTRPPLDFVGKICLQSDL